MTAQFTPGEWSVGEYPAGELNGKIAYANIEIVAPSQDDRYLTFSIGRVNLSPEHKSYMPASKEEAEANARLFSAAKQVLAVLKKYVAAGLGNSTCFDMQGEAYDAAIEIIAKIEGEQS